MFTDSFRQYGPKVAHQGGYPPLHVLPGQSNLVPTISMAKTSVKGRGKGFTGENPLELSRKNKKKTKMRRKKNAARVGGGKSGREPFIRSNCRPGGN